jgi:SAM-dependent methyltransferase
MSFSGCRNAYDEVLYPGYPFPQTHPDRLATIARLFGMQPAPVERCRVLELGCGDGGNLIPMAYALPGSEFVGIDLGARGIAKGLETIEVLGLRNISLQSLDIRDVGADLGKFDYIVAHGVYSWVPPDVQERILGICRENSNPQGVAYVSYLVYPGAHVRTMMAEMLRHHADRAATPEEWTQKTGAMLGFLSQGHALVQHEAGILAGRPPSALFHDEFSDFQSPVYFRQFVEIADRHGLQYLGEADFFEMLDASESPEIRAMLRDLTRDPIEKEQYLDFLRCRRFRQTLLCGKEAELTRRIDATGMRGFHVGAGHRGNRQPDKMPSEHPLAKEMMQVLIDVWPRSLSFAELSQRCGDADELLLCDLVLGFFACDLVRLHVYRPPFAAEPGECPRASALARIQARSASLVTNLCHQIVQLEDDLGKRLLVALDGSRNRAALLRELGDAARAEDLDISLRSLAKLALLEA